MIAIAWTTIALIAVLGFIAVYVIGFLIITVIFRKIWKSGNEIANTWHGRGWGL